MDKEKVIKIAIREALADEEKEEKIEKWIFDHLDEMQNSVKFKDSRSITKEEETQAKKAFSKYLTMAQRALKVNRTDVELDYLIDGIGDATGYSMTEDFSRRFM